VPALRRGLAAKPSLEARKRMEDLLEKIEQAPVSGERRQVLRAVEVLERAGTPEARKFLKKLAAGRPGARLTEDAHSALARLAARR